MTDQSGKMDLSSGSKTRNQTIARGVGGLVGGYVGGYPGMQIGMALGGWLFKPDEPKEKDYENTDYKTYRTKIDPVPDVIGTDMCPGKVIYLNKDTFGVYSSDQLPEMGDSVNKANWISFIDFMSSKKMGYWAEFAVNFAGRYLEHNDYEIGVVKFNNKPFWFWLLFSNMFENYDSALDPFDPISLFDASQDYWVDSLDNLDQIIGQPVDMNTVMYFKGFLADWSVLSTAPETSNITIDLNNMKNQKPGFFGSPISVFPTFSVEMNRENVWMSPESMRGGSGLPTSTAYPDADPSYQILPYTWWGCRDARNTSFHGTSTGDRAPIYIDATERKWRYAGNTGGETEAGAPAWFYDNVTKGGTSRQCTDVVADRVYVTQYRNWWNPYQGRGVYGVDKVNHHHPNYSIKFDLYYHDRSDPEQSVTPVLYDYEFIFTGLNEECNPRSYISSMQVLGDYVYLFGGRINSDIVLSDQREIVSGANSYTRVYADFSAYSDGFWNGYYAALQQEGYIKWCEIVTQTSTYLDVSDPISGPTGGWGRVPLAGEVVTVKKYPTSDCGYAIAGEGSTTTKIICIEPDPTDMCLPSASGWNKAGILGDEQTIDSINGTEINLSSAMGRAPNPGEIVYFTNPNQDYSENIVNPEMTEYNDILEELGLANIPYRASKLDGNEFSNTHHICWRVHKDTGVITVFDHERVRHPTYDGVWADWSASLNVYTCATDKQIFAYLHESYYGTSYGVYSYIIDLVSGDKEESIHRTNQYAGSHAPVWCYMGCVPVKEWNSSAQEYQDVWYTILNNFDSNGGINNALDQGVWLLRLTEGKFSNKEVVSSHGPPIRYGLNISDKGIDKIHFSKTISTGPIFGGMYLDSFPNENSYQIGKFGITEDIYFYVRRYRSQTAGRNEMWRYTPPSENDLAGELYMISKGPIASNSLDHMWLKINIAGSFQLSRYGFYGNGTGRWYHCDESPGYIIYEFWENYTDPRYFPEEMHNHLDYFDAENICKELVPATIYTNKENIDVLERRFQFSQCYDQPKKMHDVINDILMTCQGFISPCLWNSSLKWQHKIIVPNQDETPVFYFGKDSAIFTSSQESDDIKIIYADFSAYPDNYWKGDLVEYDTAVNVVTSQNSTSITIGESISPYFADAKQFTLSKDNIKEGSFVFAEKSYLDRPNKVRIEFKNRLLDYVKDTAEAEDTYRLDVLGEVEKIDFYKMHGIKRATQAGRMAQRILDQWNYQKHTCGFETDVMGMTLCMGEIIGVSHDTTGWNAKWFRIIAMEEMIDFEVKFELEEFNPYTYHDNAVPVFQGFGFGGFPQPYVPNNVERFRVIEDIEFNKLYFTFTEPTRDSGFFVGARIYRKVGTDWEFLTIVNETVSSVKLAQDIGVDDYIVYYDITTVLGSFPTSGVIWVENELMSYHGIDTTNGAFMNVVRGYNDTDIVEHLVDDEIYIKLREDVSVFFEMPDSWAGTTQTFRASAFTIQNLTIGLDLSPEVTVDIVGYGILPYFPESIRNRLPGTEHIFETLGLDETTAGEVIMYLIETLGMGDVSVEDIIIHLTESMGLGDSKIVSETLAQLIETMGLNDVFEVIEDDNILLTEDGDDLTFEDGDDIEYEE